jgi:manganese/zinc/iron transport system permease protein
MVLLASAFGAFSGLSGAYISFVAPAMPTGPWIVIVISTIAFISFFLAPKRGVISRMIRQRTIHQTINNENVLKVMYQLGEENKNFFIPRHLDEIIRRRKYEKTTLQTSICEDCYITDTWNRQAVCGAFPKKEKIKPSALLKFTGYGNST